MEYITYKYKIPIKDKYDIIVCGGGLSGIAAALQAARLKKKVLIIEKCQKLGGLSTSGLINFFVPMCNGRGRQIIFGMAEEFLRLSIENGFDTIPEDWKKENSNSRYVTKFAPEIFALKLVKLLNDAGVTIMFDSIIIDAVNGNGRCMGVVVQNVSGLQYFIADMFVEATGDCSLAKQLGIPIQKRGNYHTYGARKVDINSCSKAVKENNIRYAVTDIHSGKASLYGNNQPENIELYDGTKAEDVNRYIISNQLEMLDGIKNKDRLSYEIVTLPSMVQFRTAACIRGEHIFSEKDAFIHFDDSIALINDFDRNDFLYEVPYRTMINKKINNVIAVGRCASADGYGWDLLRVIPPAIITGQAAGFAVSLAIEQNCDLLCVDISSVQTALENAGVLLHFEEGWKTEKLDYSFQNVEES